MIGARLLKDRHSESPPPARGSSLKRDDNACHTFPISGYVHGLISSALDHLVVLADVTEGTGKLPPLASLTLVRTAIEASSIAIWLISKPSRIERVEHRIRLVFEGVDKEKAATNEISKFFEMNPEEPERDYFSQHIEGPRLNMEGVILGKLKSISQKNSLEFPPKKVTDSTSIIEAAGKICFGEKSKVMPVFFWRNCSGIAHSKEWATLKATHKRQITKALGGVAKFKFSANSSFITTAYGCAMALVSEAYKLYLTGIGETPKPMIASIRQNSDGSIKSEGAGTPPSVITQGKNISWKPTRI